MNHRYAALTAAAAMMALAPVAAPSSRKRPKPEPEPATPRALPPRSATEPVRHAGAREIARRQRQAARRDRNRTDA